MLEQIDAKYSYTIPYYTTKSLETSELFVSEPTYETFLSLSNKHPFIIIDGSLHPISYELGNITTTLFDEDKAIITVGTLDLEEYTNELLDITLASELEKVALFNKDSFFYYMYGNNTPELKVQFIDDFQQVLLNIHVSKRLISKGYRIHERELEFSKDYLLNAFHFKSIRSQSPYDNGEALFLVTKLIYLSYIDKEVFSIYKSALYQYYPLLFIEVEKILKMLRKMNFSTDNGREKAFLKVIKEINYLPYVKRIEINDIKKFEVFM